jgi:hypothetical protein
VVRGGRTKVQERSAVFAALIFTAKPQVVNAQMPHQRQLRFVHGATQRLKLAWVVEPNVSKKGISKEFVQSLVNSAQGRNCPRPFLIVGHLRRVNKWNGVQSPANRRVFPVPRSQVVGIWDREGSRPNDA